MKLYKISLALILGLGTMTSCEDKLDVVNVNQQHLWLNSQGIGGMCHRSL